MDKFKSDAWVGCSFAALVGFCCLASTPASAASGVCPTTVGHAAFGGGGVGNATDCNLFITFNANGSITTTAGPETTFDSIEDSLIGVINNTGSPIKSFVLNGGAVGIFGFDGDGIDGYANGGPIVPAIGNPDTTGYGGLDAWFTGIVGNVGTVNFLGAGIAAGGHDYFSLEEPASLNLTVNVPEPVTLSLFSAGLVGVAALRRRAKKKA
jgi:hypothetical protein